MKLRSIHTDQENGGDLFGDGATVLPPISSLGEAADAVIMKLSSRLPRIRVKVTRLTPREEDQSQPL